MSKIAFIFIIFSLYAEASKINCHQQLKQLSPNESRKIFVPPLSESLEQWGNPTSPYLSKPTFSVLIWNIQKAHQHNFQSTFNEFSKQHDLLLLQEVVKDARQNSFQTSVPYFWSYAKSFILEKKQQSTGVAIGTKTTPMSTHVLRSVAKEPLLKSPKMVLLQWFKLEGSSEQILVANVHSVNFVNDKLYANELLRLQKELEKHSGPILLAGDFNTWNKNRLKKLQKMSAELQLTEVLFPDHDHRKKFKNIPLDHAFVRQLQVQESKILDVPGASDHAAIELKLTF